MAKLKSTLKTAASGFTAAMEKVSQQRANVRVFKFDKKGSKIVLDWPTKQLERAKPVVRRHKCLKKRYEKWTNKMIDLGKIRGRRLAAKARRKAAEKKELERRKQVGEKTPKKLPGGHKNSKRK